MDRASSYLYLGRLIGSIRKGDRSSVLFYERKTAEQRLPSG